MTIAAGFVCDEGVLLCADTEHRGWTLKFHESKLDHFEIPGGKIAFALAGHTSFAWSAIQKCRDRLNAIAPKDTVIELEQILEIEYRRNVLAHPGYPDGNYYYHLLIAVWAPGQRVELYVTDETCIRKVDGFECVGTGRELASFIIRPTYVRLMPERRALSLAAYTLAEVKESIAGCGGMSVYLLLQNDGQVGTLTSSHKGKCEQLEVYSKSYDFITRELLMALTDEEKEDTDFERYLTETFNQRILQVRHEWTHERQTREIEFAALNPHLTPEQAKQAFRQWSMGLLPGPLPPQR
jgi:20S proteasome alpha/beta subunit